MARRRSQSAFAVACAAILVAFAPGVAWTQAPASAVQALPDRPVPGPVSGESSGLPLPRWVSLRADVVNLRTGPGVRYPIDWVFERRGLPVEVIGEFEAWRQIRAQDGTVGWVHQSMLSGRRTAAVTDGGTRLLAAPSSGAAVTAFVEPGVRGTLAACEGQWCRLVPDGHEAAAGWIPRSALWGAYEGENFK